MAWQDCAAVDSLSAISYAHVCPIRSSKGYIVDFKATGAFHKFGNDDDRVDLLDKELTHRMINELCRTPA